MLEIIESEGAAVLNVRSAAHDRRLAVAFSLALSAWAPPAAGSFRRWGCRWMASCLPCCRGSWAA
jgi:hypothetical protein